MTFLFAVTPSAAIAWAGCSSDNKGGTSGTAVDPGGIFGAEVTVTVIGRGRVTSTVAGVDCPNDCFARFVFKDSAQPGASGGVTLKATPTPGFKFLGWKFDNTPLGTRGRGPENCNPIKREAAMPAVDLNAMEINFPYGEVKGTPPAGQENLCVGVTAVPQAYNLTATFESVIDAGIEAEAEAGIPDVFLEPPLGLTGYQAKEIGILSGRLYVRYESPLNNTSQIATASTSIPGGLFQVVTNTSGNYNAFEIGNDGNGHVVWQNSLGNIGVIQGGSTTAQLFSNAGNTCVAIDSDFSNVYCRTAGPNGSLVSWTTAGTNIMTLHSGLPTGTELAVDSSFFYISDTSLGLGANSLKYITKVATPDAGAPTLNQVTTNSLTNQPFALEVNSSRLLWLDYDTGATVGIAESVSRTGGTPFVSSPATVGLRLLSTDPNSTLAYFVGVVPSNVTGASSIAKLSTSSMISTMVRQNLTGVGGIAADSSYVYWTQIDGRVYRAQRTSF